MEIAEYVNMVFENIKKLWNQFDVKKIAESIGGSSAEAVEAAIYFCLSFGTGFFFKKYFKIICICLVFSLISIKALEYAKFLTVDWVALKAFIGISSGDDFNVITNRCFDWIKDHLLLFISMAIGFLVGYKLG